MAWRPIEEIPDDLKDGREIPMLSRSYEGPIMLAWRAPRQHERNVKPGRYGETWRDWDGEQIIPEWYFVLPAPPTDGETND